MGAHVPMGARNTRNVSVESSNLFASTISERCCMLKLAVLEYKTHPETKVFDDAATVDEIREWAKQKGDFIFDLSRTEVGKDTWLLVFRERGFRE